MSLSEKQKAFVRELPRQGFNLTSAARAAGYASPGMAGSRLMKNDHIQRALAEKLQPLLEQSDIDSRAVLEELGSVGFSKITDYTRWNDDGDSYMIPSQDLTLEQAAAIKKVRITTRRVDLGEGKEMVESTIQLELHDKLAALRILAKATNLVDEFGHRAEDDRPCVIIMPAQTEGLPPYVGDEVELEERDKGAFALTAEGPRPTTWRPLQGAAGAEISGSQSK